MEKKTVAHAIFRSTFSGPLLVALTACGGGGDGNANPPPPPNASPGGIWEGSTSTGLTILGLVTENGEYHFIQSDGVQYYGRFDTDGNDLSALINGVTAFETVFPDGSTTGTGTFTGTVEERSEMTGDSHFTTELGNTSDSTIALTYNDLYDRNSSLTTIAGNYRDPDTNAIINVNSDGVIFSQDAVTGCVINGQIEVMDTNFNLYAVAYEFSNCMGAAAILNGTTARGTGTLDNTVVPEQAVIGVKYQDARDGYAFVGVFPRT